MKKIKKLLNLISCLSIVFAMLSGMCTVSAAESGITVSIDGKNVAFDVPPQLINNRTMVPLRAIFEALGAAVEWNDNMHMVIATKGNKEIHIPMNFPDKMYINGVMTILDSPACLIDGRTLVPVRAISEAFGTTVDWDSGTQTVTISTVTAEKEQTKNDINNTADTADKDKATDKNNVTDKNDAKDKNNATDKANEVTWYSSSMYRVGTDIPAGDYYAVTDENKYSGYYCKYNDSTQDDIEDNDNFKTFTFFRCYDGQYLKLSSCKITPIENAPVLSPDNGVYGEGMYRVGIDMPEGEYKFTAADEISKGYYCAYTDITYNDIDDNDNFDGAAYYTVKNGQYLKLNRCTAVCITEQKSNNVKDNSDKYDSQDDNKDAFEENADREAPYQKLKSWLVENGRKTSSGDYGIIHILDDGSTISIIYLPKKDYIGFMDTTKKGGTVTLFVYEDKNPEVTYETPSGSFFSGEYKTSEITFTHMDVPGMENSLIKVFNSFYKVADTFMILKNIDVKVSDFGIDY